MVEPGLVQTKMTDDILADVKAVEGNDSVDDKDRECGRLFGKAMDAIPKIKADDVAAKILEVIEAEKPMLRYPIPEEFIQNSFLDLLCDTTGEKVVALQLSRITENS